MLVVPAYHKLAGEKDIYAKKVRVVIAGREFDIPQAYVWSRPQNGYVKDTVLLEYILPDFKSQLELSTQERNARLQDGSDLLLEAAANRPDLEVMLSNRRYSLAKEEPVDPQYGLWLKLYLNFSRLF